MVIGAYSSWSILSSKPRLSQMFNQLESSCLTNMASSIENVAPKVLISPKCTINWFQMPLKVLVTSRLSGTFWWVDNWTSHNPSQLDKLKIWILLLLIKATSAVVKIPTRVEAMINRIQTMIVVPCNKLSMLLWSFLLNLNSVVQLDWVFSSN